MNKSNREQFKALGQAIYKEQYYDLHQKDKNKDIQMKSAPNSNFSASSSSTLYGRQLSINYTNHEECMPYNRQSYSTKPDYEIIGSEGYKAGNMSPDSLPDSPNNPGNAENRNYLDPYAVGYDLEGHGRMADFSTNATRTEASNLNKQVNCTHTLNQYINHCNYINEKPHETNGCHYPNGSLIDAFLAKKMNTCRTKFLRQTSPLRNLQHCQDNNLKSESYLESRSGSTSSRQADVEQFATSFANNVHNLSECYPSNSQLHEDGPDNHCSKTTGTAELASRNQKRGTSFMLPTMSSEQKNQQHLINSLSQLISPSRPSASSSPNRRDLKMESLKEPVPYFEQAHMPTEKNISVHYEDSQSEKQNTPHREHLPAKKKNDETLKLDLHKLRLNSSQNKNGVTNPDASSKEQLIFQTMQRVKSMEWEVALNGLAEITELCQDVETDAIYPHMTNVNQKLIELLRSPRSHVTRTACQIAGRLFELMRDTRRPEFDDIVEILLNKTADASKFIRNDANLSLDTMVTHIPIYHAVKSICLKGPHHKNPLVRSASIRLIICAVVIADPVHVHEYTKKRIIQFLPQALSDRHLETRKFGERLYKILSKDPDFDIHFKKYLEPKEIDRLNCMVKNEMKKR